MLIESQARGVPVVSTNVGGVNESLSDGSTGILLKDEDIGTIKSALTLILDDWDTDDTSGACISFIEQKFGMERMARDTKEAYESLLSSM